MQCERHSRMGGCRGLVLAGLFALAFAPAASTQTGTIFACPDPDSQFCQDFLVDETVTLQDAIDTANSNDSITEVIVFGDAANQYTLSVPLNIERGYRITGAGAPQDIVITYMGTGPVIHIQASDVIIEGLTVTGGNDAAITVGGMDPVTGVAINRCYLRESAGNGVTIEDDAEAFILNSSIWNNALNGVESRDTTGTTSKVLSCTVHENGEHGIRVDDASGDFVVKNTIVVRNTLFGMSAAMGAAVATEANYVSENRSAAAPSLCDPDENFENISPLPTNATCAGDETLQFNSTDWQGQEPQEPDLNNPLVREQGISVQTDLVTGLFDLALLDFDGHLRPSDSNGVPGLGQEDIGADEFAADVGDLGGWVFTRILPSPVGPLQPGEMTVIMAFEGNPASFDEFPYEDGTDRVVLVPELSIADANTNSNEFFGDPDLADYAMPLNIQPLGDSRFWIGTNALAIETEGLSRTGNLTVFDGRAQIFLVNGSVNGSGSTYTPQDPLGQAVEGREEVVDTTPPVLDVPALPSGLGGGDFVISSSDDVTAGTVLPPKVPADFPSNWPGTDFVPVSNGLVTAQPGGPGAKVFFNEGADDGTPTMGFTVQVPVIDPQPVVSGTQFQIERAGFDGRLDDGPTIGPFTGSAVLNLLQTGIPGFASGPRWVIDEGSQFLQGSTLQVQFEDVTGSLASGRLPRIVANYIFTDVPFADGFHVKTRFGATDAASNVTPEAELLDPLTIWWMQETSTVLSPYYNTEVRRPAFEWQLSRSAEPGRSSPADPIFRYRVYAAINGQEKNGPIAPVNDSVLLDQGLSEVTALTSGANNGWSLGWTRQGGIGFNWFTQAGGLVDAGYTDRWLYFQVIGADEAGNVTPFVVPDPSAASGPNWQRFLISSGDLADSKVSAVFWHDRTGNTPRGARDSGESIFANARIVPLPPEEAFPAGPRGAFSFETYAEQVVGEFTAVVDSPPDASTVSASFILRRANGDAVGSALVPGLQPGRATVRLLVGNGLTAQADAIIGALLGDTKRTENQSFVLEVIATADGQSDPTRSNYPFTVVPDVAEYIQNKSDPDDQPIKVLEGN